MNARRAGAYAAGILGIVLLVAILAQIFEIREIEVARRQGRAASNDPWLALDRILSPGRAVERYSSLEDIRLESAALVVADGDELAYLDAYGGGASGLARWVKDGGRLVISWDKSWDDEDGFEKIASFPGIEPTGNMSIYGEPRASGKYRASDVDIPYNGFLKFGPGKAIDGYWGFSNGKDDRVVLVESGKGWILAGASGLFLENRELADEGGMAFAELLLGDLDPGRAWFPEPTVEEAPAISDEASSRKSFIPVAIAAAILCLVLLWKEAPRFGPFIAEDSAERRGMAERFRAEGRFLVERGAGGSVLERIGDDSDGRPAARAKRSPRRYKKMILAVIRARAAKAAERDEGRGT